MATRILADAELVKDQSYVKYAEKLLKNFVQKFTQVYPDCNVSYNIHTLMHISKDVIKFGKLDLCSALIFQVENLLEILKRRIRCVKKSIKPRGGFSNDLRESLTCGKLLRHKLYSIQRNYE